jgi:hypothetical protein
MTEQNLQQHLYDLLAATTLADFTDDDQISVPHELVDSEEGIDWVSTFAEAGVLTSNAGVVVRMKDRREFQISIVRSR